MTKYLKEIIVLIIQLLAFYVFPLTAGPTDGMGLVVLLLLITLLLSLLLGIISRNKIKLLYPVVIAVLFIPTIFIYYNESALIHAVWYLVDSAIGMIVGSFIHKLAIRKKK